MPLPKPKGKEKKKDFMSRCMGNEEVNSEFPEKERRGAICSAKWEESKSEAAFTAGEDDDEQIFYPMVGGLDFLNTLNIDDTKAKT